jgi:hypothetical protein
VNVKRAAEIALCERMKALGVPVDNNCRAEHLRQVVVDTVDDASLGQVLADLREGSGGELTATDAHRPKFHSAFSSCGLAVNAFGPWRLDPNDLGISGNNSWSTLRFEAQRPIFASKATPPNLDVLFTADDRVVAVESKLTEFLAGHETASFAERYHEVVDELAHESWAAMYALLTAEPRRFAFLNADQLVKHYLGLRRAQIEDPRPVELLYLYWEPTNADDVSVFLEHRREVAEFAALVDDPQIRFRGYSYPALWNEWEGAGGDRVDTHLQRLRERYAVAVDI